MSANTGVVGNGYANAGLFGVFAYSSIVGIFVSILNSFGRRIGHTFVTAASVYMIFLLMTTTDLITAILSHGLLLLIFMLSIIGPGETVQAGMLRARR
jgi:hypothetical protein